MDLHDFKDVAENYDRYLDVMYSGERDRHENFQEFYLELAKKYGQGGVVDIAAEQVRSCFILQREGLRLTARISPRKCARLRRLRLRK